MTGEITAAGEARIRRDLIDVALGRSPADTLLRLDRLLDQLDRLLDR